MGSPSMTEQEQIKTLKAQVNCLRKALTNAVKAPNYTFHYAKEALEATPEQCLAEVKAMAIRDMQRELPTFGAVIDDNGEDLYEVIKHSDVVKYVRRLEEQAK